VEKQKKSAMIRFTGILLAVSAILLCASPCDALVVPLPGGETTLNVDYEINDSVTVHDGGTLNLLDGGVINYPSNEWLVVDTGGTLNLSDGGVINGALGIQNGGKLNIEGGYISNDVLVVGGSEVNIKGGEIGGDMYWDIALEEAGKVTVFGTGFEVENGEIDSSEDYFTPDLWSSCFLTGVYGGDAGSFELVFYVFSSNDVKIFLAPPALEMMIDIKPGSDQNCINRGSRGVVPVAVLTTGDFDVCMINPDTAQFAGAWPERWKLVDVDDDGDDDLLFHFRTQDLNLLDSSTEATLTADLFTGEEVFGTDEVRIVPSKKNK
jgi:hypothetical protein